MGILGKNLVEPLNRGNRFSSGICLEAFWGGGRAQAKKLLKCLTE